MILLPALIPGAVNALGSPTAGPPIVSGAGLVDFSNTARLKPGQWVTYKVSTYESGQVRESMQKISVAGFVTYKGEKCIWIETEFAPKGSIPTYVKTLISLAISKAPDHDYVKAMPQNQRKVHTYDGHGQVSELDFPRVETMKSQPNPSVSQNVKDSRDTLAATEVITDAGKFHALPARFTRDAHFLVKDKNGERIYRRQVEEQVTYLAREIPVTSLAKQTYTVSLLVAPVPPDKPDDYVPTLAPQGLRREAVAVAFGTGAKSAFPKNAKIVPMNIPTREISPGTPPGR